ncbi:MgtC/SapB family protein [Humibacillus xanthopallidus]|uniref:Putative Mg2+ transporter-C (MgtC) family protein n=1 Tax=Humibacillus xanthopallidus TaxID=412689 RepID=A0A543HHT7_9MICO|nr:MgtC/SapB family protein [Humibacillus xanthopallidus]TQM57882.1 putative Mg2+ transporter-C (MgtC) family protein [Humibacillus xanthopallidus]
MRWVSATTWTETGLLGLAFVLSAIIGLERHRRFKSAGLRTHTLVGVGSAVFTLVSAYGFADVTGRGVVDPSRIAAQIVSGVGFLGAGVIFVRRGSVSGLTTAASIWLTAAVGMACGAGMPALAVMATGCQLLAVTVLAKLGRRMASDPVSTRLLMRYTAGRGTMPLALGLAAEHGVPATVIDAKTSEQDGKKTTVRAIVQLEGNPQLVSDLVEEISDLASVESLRVLTDEGLSN